MAEARDEPRRIITKITFTYRLRDDPKGRERTCTVKHDGDGEGIDGIVWNRALVKKLAYREPSGYVDAETRTGRKGWSTDLKRASDNCFWLHEADCSWWELCGPPDEDPV